jgi:Arc/MetJ-type ribon-helix-helix transcriptional regulator
MAEVQINLPDSIGQFASAQVASGRFPTIHEYVVALVSADVQAQHTLDKLSANAQLAAFLEEGLRSPEGRCWSPTVLQELKQQVFNRTAGNDT